MLPSVTPHITDSPHPLSQPCHICIEFLQFLWSRESVYIILYIQVAAVWECFPGCWNPSCGLSLDFIGVGCLTIIVFVGLWACNQVCNPECYLDHPTICCHFDFIVCALYCSLCTAHCAHCSFTALILHICVHSLYCVFSCVAFIYCTLFYTVLCTIWAVTTDLWFTLFLALYSVQCV